jgi:VCBS repeat-containing protein
MLMSLILVATAWGVVFDDPDNFGVKRTWAGSSLSVPGNLGGMLFSGDGQTLYVVGNSERSYSALYAVPLTRDPVTKEVTDMGPAANVTLVFSGAPDIAGLDAGWDIGPQGTLFYTYWSANYLGERPGGISGAETLYYMADVSLPSSIAGLAFSPYIRDPNTNFGVMQVSVWGSNRTLYNVPLTPLGGVLCGTHGGVWGVIRVNLNNVRIKIDGPQMNTIRSNYEKRRVN